MAPARSESVCKSRSGTSIRRDCFRQQAIDPDFAQYTGPRNVLIPRQPLHGVVKEFPLGFQDSFQCLFDRPAATETVYPHLTALADPYYPVSCLIVGRGIPPLIEQEDVVGLYQRKSFAPDSGRSEQCE